MERRSFIAGIGALVGGIAIEKAIPFGRVWSFPKQIKCVNFAEGYGSIEYWSVYNRAMQTYVSAYNNYLDKSISTGVGYFKLSLATEPQSSFEVSSQESR